mmetsp:Transcript_27421/g.36676  ORF Transcript_27421/g.36676 Transcript_27421/m.36676 type:complete len:117 (+) Transcript_27421:604-954(+)
MNHASEVKEEQQSFQVISHSVPMQQLVLSGQKKLRDNRVMRMTQSVSPRHSKKSQAGTQTIESSSYSCRAIRHVSICSRQSRRHSDEQDEEENGYGESKQILVLELDSQSSKESAN